MDIPTTITVHFKEGRTEAYHNVTFETVAWELIEANYNVQDAPIKIHIGNVNKSVLYLPLALHWYIKEHITFDELIERFWADGVYRNRIKLYTQHDVAVDPDALWIRRGNNMLLVDEDEYVGCEYNDFQFYEIL